MHQGQTVDQYGHIIAIRVAACLLKLTDDLYLVTSNILFIQQVDVFNASVIKDKVMNVIVVNLASFIDNTVGGVIQPCIHKT